MAKPRRAASMRSITRPILDPDTVKFSFQFVDFEQSWKLCIDPIPLDGKSYFGPPRIN